MSILFGGDKVRPQLSAACRTGACVGESVLFCEEAARAERRGFQGKSVKSNPSSLSVIEACGKQQVDEGRESVA